MNFAEVMGSLFFGVGLARTLDPSRFDFVGIASSSSSTKS
jgi:hypothetical protein